MTRSPVVRYAIRRLAWAVASLVAVLTVVFVLVAATPDPNVAAAQFGAAASGENGTAAAESYRAARDRDVPVLQRYVGFLADLARLRLGVSYQGGEPVAGIVLDATRVSAAYVLPATLVSVGIGGSLGLYASLSDSRLFDRLTGALAYAGLGIPAFWIAVTASAFVADASETVWRYTTDVGPLAPPNRVYVVFTAAALATTLLPAQLRYVRAETDTYVREPFVKTAEAKGAGLVRVGRHVLRNAVAPLLSLFVAELLGVLFLTGFILEIVLGVPGLGLVLFEAATQRDVPVVMGVTLVLVTLAVAGRFLVDVLGRAMDPRTAS